MYKLAGLKIKEIRGYRESNIYGVSSKRKKGFSPEYILFTDKETFIHLDEQDAYDYHDCNSIARTVDIHRDKATWKIIYEDKFGYPIADMNYD